MQDWIDFLTTQKTLPLQHNNAFCALTETGLLYVGGDDAKEFLQNQLSNDIDKISEHLAQFSSISSAKGRMFGIFRVIQIDGGYILVMPKSILESIQQRLQKFIVRSQVVLADISDSFSGISITTDNIELIQQLNLTAQTDGEGVHSVVQTENQITLKVHAAKGRSRYMIFNNDAKQLMDLWQRVSPILTLNAPSHFRLQEIEAGIPSVFPETSEAFVLQMSNLHLLDGVSFKKGCYPGQEVVARMKYLGKLKRRMYLASVSGMPCPSAGDDLTTKGSDRADGSGKVVDAVQLTETETMMLFVAKIEPTEANELVLFKHPEQAFSLTPLPYPYDEQ